MFFKGPPSPIKLFIFKLSLNCLSLIFLVTGHLHKMSLNSNQYLLIILLGWFSKKSLFSIPMSNFHWLQILRWFLYYQHQLVKLSFLGRNHISLSASHHQLKWNNPAYTHHHLLLAAFFPVPFPLSSLLFSYITMSSVIPSANYSLHFVINISHHPLITHSSSSTNIGFNIEAKQSSISTF